jgi:hypothetical protein
MISIKVMGNMRYEANHPLIKNTARFSNLALAVSLLWTSALGSVVLMSLASSGSGSDTGIIRVGGAPFGDDDDNDARVPCTFQIDFYGYARENLWADVTFEQQPPTNGVKMTVTGNKRVFIGGDDNAGGASVAGLDASEKYSLGFSGASSRPSQGYKVKLTIHADGSAGSDEMDETFWVEPCAVVTPKPATPTPKATATPRPTATPVVVAGTSTPKPSVTPAAGSPTPTPGGSGGSTSTPTPVIAAGSPTPTPGAASPTPSPTSSPSVEVGAANPTPEPGQEKSASSGVSGFLKNLGDPVQIGALRVPNGGLALFLLLLLLVAVPATLVLIVWSIRRKLAERGSSEPVASEGESAGSSEGAALGDEPTTAAAPTADEEPMQHDAEVSPTDEELESSDDDNQKPNTGE